MGAKPGRKKLAIDYIGIQTALQALIEADIEAGNFTDEIKKVFLEATARDLVYDNMPMINIRLSSGVMEPRSLPNGYHFTGLFEIDVHTYDFTNFVSAATVRDRILNELQLLIQKNSRFHADLDTSMISRQIGFGAAEIEGAQGHVAIVTFQVTFEVTVDANI